MNKNLVPLLAAVAMVAIPALSSAQLRELNSTRDGSGSLGFRTRSSGSDVSQVRVELRRNGEAIIEFTRGVRERFEGFWREEGNRRVEIEIRKIGRDNATGNARIDLDGRGSFTKLEGDGRLRDGSASFRFNFETGRTSGGPGGNPGNQFGAFSSTRRGEGNMNFRTRSSNSRISELRVELRPNGEFEIRPTDRGFDSVRGNWYVERGRVQLDVENFGRDRARGNGTLEPDGRGSFNRVELNGTVNDVQFSLSFRTTNTNSGNWSPEDSRYRDSARRAIEQQFRGQTRFDWFDEEIRVESNGDRVITGRFEAFGGNRDGRYRYRVVLWSNGGIKASRFDREQGR